MGPRDYITRFQIVVGDRIWFRRIVDSANRVTEVVVFIVVIVAVALDVDVAVAGDVDVAVAAAAGGLERTCRRCRSRTLCCHRK